MYRLRHRDRKALANIFHPFPSVAWDPKASCYWYKSTQKQTWTFYNNHHTLHMNSQQPTTEEPPQSSLKRAEALGSSAWTSIVFRLLRQRVGRSDSRPLCPPENESQHVCTAGAPQARRPPPAPGGRKEGREDLTKGSPPPPHPGEETSDGDAGPQGPSSPPPHTGAGWGLTDRGGGFKRERTLD